MTHFFSSTQGAWRRRRVSIRETELLGVSAFSICLYNHTILTGLKAVMWWRWWRDGRIWWKSSQTNISALCECMSKSVCSVCVSESVCRFPGEALAERHLSKPPGWTDGGSLAKINPHERRVEDERWQGRSCTCARTQTAEKLLAHRVI